MDGTEVCMDWKLGSPDLDQIRASAKAGDANAQFRLARLLATGLVIPTNHDEAFRWYRAAARQGHIRAKLYRRSIIAGCFTYGGIFLLILAPIILITVSINKWRELFAPLRRSKYRKRFEKLRADAENGDIEAQFEYGRRMARIPDSSAETAAEAAGWFAKAAESGHDEAQYELGSLYINGTGVRLDLAEAVKWIRKAAEQGHTGALIDLGDMYETGDGVPEDIAEAAKCFRKAGEQGSSLAQENMGWLYAEGRGVPQDSAEAVNWFYKLIKQGFEDSVVLGWIQETSHQGLPEAQYLLGVMYNDGRGGLRPENIKAYMWLRIAAAGIADEKRDQVTESINLVASQMTPEEIVQAEQLAQEWRPRSG